MTICCFSLFYIIPSSVSLYLYCYLDKTSILKTLWELLYYSIVIQYEVRRHVTIWIQNNVQSLHILFIDYLEKHLIHQFSIQSILLKNAGGLDVTHNAIDEWWVYTADRFVYRQPHSHREMVAVSPNLLVCWHRKDTQTVWGVFQTQDLHAVTRQC